MNRRRSTHWTAVVLAAALSTAGCGGSTGTTGTTDTTGHDSGPGVMGGNSHMYAVQSCSAPTSLPGLTVQVTLADTGRSPMVGAGAPLGERRSLRAAPKAIPSGQVSFIATNLGGLTHKLVSLPRTAATGEGQRVPGAEGTVSETGSLAEASGACAGGAGEGIPAGAVSWITVTLAPGHYDLVRNVPQHYGDGMHQELVVT